MRRFLSLILTLSLLLCALPLGMLAEAAEPVIKIAPVTEDLGENIAPYVLPYYTAEDGRSRVLSTGLGEVNDRDVDTATGVYVDPAYRYNGVKGNIVFYFTQYVAVTDVIIRLANNKLNKFAIEYSNDNENWTRLYTGVYPKPVEHISFPVVKAKWYRIAILSCEYVPQFAEIEFYNTSDEQTFEDKEKLIPPPAFGELKEHSQVQLLTELKEPADAKIVHEDENGDLVYEAYDERGQKLGDWGRVGYKAGTEPIPFIETVVTVTPNGVDDTKAIQMAIDQVAAMPIQENGFRGAVYLDKGVYYVSDPIHINHSGIVIRGAGNTGSGEDGTLIIATAAKQYVLFNFVGLEKQNVYEKVGRDYKIVGDYYGTGTRELKLDSTKGLEKGDEIIVYRPPSAEWLAEIKMDANGGIIVGDGKYPWKPESYSFSFERKIVEVTEDSIILDIPLVQSMQKEFGLGTVYKYTTSGRINHVGIEDLAIEAAYDETVVNENGRCIDEEHMTTSVYFQWCVDGWERNVSSKHLYMSGALVDDYAKNITIENCQVTDYVCVVTGGRGYSFDLDGQQSLVINCHAEGGRHDYVINARGGRGPNAFVDSTAENTQNSSEPHQRYSMGGLWDNIVTKGNDRTGLAAFNRGATGSGHGWAGSHMMFWNCASGFIMVQEVPGNQNFAVGLSEVLKLEDPENGMGVPISEVIRYINWAHHVSGVQWYYQGEPFVGDGYFELNDRPAKIRSLYARQRIEAYKDLSYFFRADDSGYIYLNKRRDCENALFYENGNVMIPMNLAREVLNKKTEEELLALAETSTQKDGVTYLPLRKLFENAGMKVYYQDGTITVTEYDDYFMTEEEIEGVLRSINLKF